MKIPKPTEADRERFTGLVPDAPHVEIKPMFGNLGAFVNGNMFMGLFGSDVGIKLPEDDQQRLLAEPGAGPFGPEERPMAGYVAKLAPGGILAYHISNRYLALEPVVAGAASDLGLESWIQENEPSAEERAQGKATSTWMIVARDAKDVAELVTPPSRWRSSKAVPGARIDGFQGSRAGDGQARFRDLGNSGWIERNGFSRGHEVTPGR